MAKDKKPTQEDLEISLKKTEEELEIIEKDEEKKVEEVKNKVENTEVPEKVEEEPKEEEDKKEAPIEEEKEEEPAPSEPAPSPDYKEKFSESSREAQKIHAKNRKINEAVAKGSEITNVEEEELTKEYPDWDVMSDTEKRLAKDNLINKKRFDLVAKATEEAKKIEKWGEDVDKFSDDPKTLITYPELEGKIDEFKVFASKTEHNAVPFNVLVGAFLHNMENTKKKSKGKMFEMGSGGPNEKLKNKGNKISLDEARILMKNDYKKYKEYLLAGKIDTSEI